MTSRSPGAPRVRPLLRGVSHEVACGIAFAFGAWLVADAPSARAVVSAAIYATSLVAMLGISALYHRRLWRPAARQRMRRLDHSAIFILIAGSYTPVCMLALPPARGTIILWLAWIGAGVGIVQVLLWTRPPRWVTAGIYLALGWLCMSSGHQLLTGIGVGRLAFILGGGLLYSVGAIIYWTRRPDPFPRVFGYHEVFHALVIAAAVCHFLAIRSIVLSG